MLSCVIQGLVVKCLVGSEMFRLEEIVKEPDKYEVAIRVVTPDKTIQKGRVLGKFRKLSFAEAAKESLARRARVYPRNLGIFHKDQHVT
jgi:hypothetical protein